VIKESVKLNKWHNTVKVNFVVETKYIEKQKKNYCTWDRTQTISLQGSIHTTVPIGSSVEVLYIEYLT